MRFVPTVTEEGMAERLSTFLNLCGQVRWERRVEQLVADVYSSPYRAKTIFERHWLELSISDYIASQGPSPEPEYIRGLLPALKFSSIVVDVHARLNPRGQSNLRGRLLDGINTSFAGLYLELEIAAELLSEGYQVTFPDFEGVDRYDIQFSKDGVEGEFECKSISVDAGRKIHRHDFYRLVERLAPHTWPRRENRCVVVVELSDRLPGDDYGQKQLSESILSVVAGATESLLGNGISIRFESLSPAFMPTDAGEDLYKILQRDYGANCHIAGGLSETSGCLLVLRSNREDDISKPQLQALKAAAEQLSEIRPGFVAVQFEDLEPRSLALSHLQRRCAILASAVFNDDRYPHVAAIYHRAYQRDSIGGHNGASPSFVAWNSRWLAKRENLPFASGLSEFDFFDPLDTDRSADLDQVDNGP